MGALDGLFGGTLGHKSNREDDGAYQQIIDPFYEAKSDQDIACELAESWASRALMCTLRCEAAVFQSAGFHGGV